MPARNTATCRCSPSGPRCAGKPTTALPPAGRSWACRGRLRRSGLSRRTVQSSITRSAALSPGAETVTLERVGHVAVATLCRAPVNALDDALIARLDAVLDQIVDDDEVT